jgi:condensin complex subunit 1
MAEQALNTIYLLGQQPDALCGEIIKTLTAKVFSKPSATKSVVDTESEKDSEAAQSPSAVGTMSRSGSQNSLQAGSQASMQVDTEPKSDEVGAFALAQLLFVVGHVALKHIVYLELVEREFKRRKDEKAKGELTEV